MDALTLFGLFSVTAMLLCYAFESLGPWITLAFAGSCALSSLYGFLQGAWPIGLVEGIWALVALYKFRQRLRGEVSLPPLAMPDAGMESRNERTRSSSK